MADRLTAMISSTARDLPEHRSQVMNACLERGVFPIMMERLPASDADAIAVSLAMVDRADIYLGIIAWRYGYVPEGHDISITEMEYNRAVERGIPRLLFLMHDDHPIRAADVETGENAVKLAALRARIGTERVVAFFKSPAELKGQALNALVDVPRPTTAGPAVDLRPRFTVPAPPSDFVGRTGELDTLETALRQAAESSGGAAIAGLRGLGGVGKTTLAQMAASRVRTLFPDGALLLDMRGTAQPPDTPTAPVGALAQVIRAFAGADVRLPGDLPTLTAAYRDILAGKRVLILADNAADAAQVACLAPPSGCALLITSRQHFTMPGLTPLNLDALPLPEAVALAQRICRRITAGQAARLARLTGRLPLAIRVSASRLLDDPVPVERYLDRLENERQRLAALRSDDDPALDVAASLGLSYRALAATLQAVLTQLSVFAAPFAREAAEAVVRVDGLPEGGVEAALTALYRRSLVEWAETDDLFSLHDLVRVFAAEQADAVGVDLNAAALRHAWHYFNEGAKADTLYEQGGENVVAGLGRFEAAWPNLSAAWAGLQIKDRSAEAAHLNNLGLAYAALGETHRAIDFYEQRLVIAREIGDRRGEHNTLGNLGTAYAILGETDKAADCYLQSIAIAQATGDRRGEANSSWNGGLLLEEQGEYARAADLMQVLVDYWCEIGHPEAERRLAMKLRSPTVG